MLSQDSDRNLLPARIEPGHSSVFGRLIPPCADDPAHDDARNHEVVLAVNTDRVVVVVAADGPELDANMVRAAANIPRIDLLADAGANVYDILRCDRLVLTTAAVRRLEERLG